MKKIGILTFHYSNNYGGVLQTIALQKIIDSMDCDAEVINFIPANYSTGKIMNILGIKKNILKNNAGDLNIINIIKKVCIMKKYSGTITDKFNVYRQKEMKLSERVDESSLSSILSHYDAIVVGSDQVWNPSQRKRPEYFLDYGDIYNGGRISYAADSTTKEIDAGLTDSLNTALQRFRYISVRNEHSFEFVKAITGRETDIVADPTVLYDFQTAESVNAEEYILAYVLGKEIGGTHQKAIEEIRKIYGSLPVILIKVPTVKFELAGFADKVLYDAGPDEWIQMIKNAAFVYTDSYHGVLFSLKYHIPFLAYYTESMRATRFLDLEKRYHIERYIVKHTDEIGQKESIKQEPDFGFIDSLLESHRELSLEFLKKALR